MLWLATRKGVSEVCCRIFNVVQLLFRGCDIEDAVTLVKAKCNEDVFLQQKKSKMKEDCCNDMFDVFVEGKVATELEAGGVGGSVWVRDIGTIKERV